MTAPRRWKLRLSRDAALFLGGMTGIAHETFVSSVERPGLLVLFGAMVGLPAFLRADASEKDR